MKNTSLVDQDNVYVPRCIGVLSHWPWHDFFKDWLCELYKVVRGSYDDVEHKKPGMLVPLERYDPSSMRDEAFCACLFIHCQINSGVW